MRPHAVLVAQGIKLSGSKWQLSLVVTASSSGADRAVDVAHRADQISNLAARCGIKHITQAPQSGLASNAPADGREAPARVVGIHWQRLRPIDRCQLTSSVSSEA